jgi:hypothetical protein
MPNLSGDFAVSLGLLLPKSVRQQWLVFGVAGHPTEEADTTPQASATKSFLFRTAEILKLEGTAFGFGML